MMFPKISHTIELLSEAKPTGTKEDKFARGSHSLKRSRLIQAVDYILTVLYLCVWGVGIYYIIRNLVQWLLKHY